MALVVCHMFAVGDAVYYVGGVLRWLHHDDFGCWCTCVVFIVWWCGRGRRGGRRGLRRGLAALGGVEQLLAKGEDGDETGDLLHLHPVVGALPAEGWMKGLKIQKKDIIAMRQTQLIRGENLL